MLTHDSLINLQLLLLSFEKYWNAYVITDGILYAKETKKEARKLCALFKETFKQEPSYTRDAMDIINAASRVSVMRTLFESLEEWANSKQKYPKVSEISSFGKQDAAKLNFRLNDFESRLSLMTNKGKNLEYYTEPKLFEFQQRYYKWLGQLPNKAIDKIDEDFIKKMSASDTIAVVADIRRSQDLITYGTSPEIYQREIMSFIKEVRSIINKHVGIYDRFTGDGFVAHFNKYLCSQAKTDYYDMMIAACREIMDYSIELFSRWSSKLRKKPQVEIGLSIGIDSGQISFVDVDNQLFAIGNSCVWATRMSDAGNSGDIIYNNIPHTFALENAKGIEFEEVLGKTKTGEEFKGYKVSGYSN